MATLGLNAEEREAVEAFRRDVVEPSMTKLVILDFWAEWCGPCKTLGPVLEAVAADYADRGVLLHKIDVDKERLIASQFQVQTIPTVYAIFQGQLVADLTPARTDASIRKTLDEILAQLPIASEAAEAKAEIEPLIAMGEEILSEGDAERALSIFEQIADLAPGEPAVVSGRARALVALGRLDEADALLAEAGDDAAIVRARSVVALAREAVPADDLAVLRATVEANPDDHGARLELAGGLIAAGDRDGAADVLLESIRRDREWNDGAARQRLLQLFEAIGLVDPWVSATRRKLSAVLFG